MVRRPWMWGVAGVALALVAVVAWMAFVWSPFSGEDPNPWSCDRGFRAADWLPAIEDSRVRTGQAIAKCGWLDGLTREQVRARLGSSDGGTKPNYMSYELGSCSCGLGPMSWFLVLRLDRESEKVVSSEAEAQGV